MGKYSDSKSDIFSIFASAPWVAENIATIPNNFNPSTIGDEYIRVSVLTSKGLNLKSLDGMLMIDIFTPAGSGPQRTDAIADRLDTYLVGKSLSTITGKVTQFFDSSLGNGKTDTDNPTLCRTIYTLTFKYNGVT